VDPTERFVELVRRPDGEIPLAEAAALVAAHAHLGLDVAGVLGALDALAEGLAGDDIEALARLLFVERGFAGNTVDYRDPRNSYLDDVLRRRLGIPISLSVVMIEVGRRAGVDVLGVGMPGHFLVRPGGSAGVWLDPFHGGECLDEDGCRARFLAVHGPGAAFRPEFLDPVGSRAILSRMLANLAGSLVAREPAAATWALRLRLRIPDVPPAERRQAAALLGSLGHFSEAAAELDALAAASPDDAAALARDAVSLRARGN
jgi:regulator of sirC expression with transglutaminase-like and TPR domain